MNARYLLLLLLAGCTADGITVPVISHTVVCVKNGKEIFRATNVSTAKITGYGTTVTFPPSYTEVSVEGNCSVTAN